MSRYEIGIIAGMMAVTFPVRYALFALGERADFPPLVRRALRFVPVAVLTSISIPIVLLPDGQHWRLDWRNAYLAGALVAAAVSWRWRHLLASIGAGLAVYLLWRGLFMR